MLGFSGETEPRDIYVVKEVNLKDLVHVIVGAGKSEICMSGQQETRVRAAVLPPESIEGIFMLTC